MEIGGTVGDNEGFHFLEAARQLSLDLGSDNVMYVHVVFLPYLKASDEVKTKPAQNSVRELRSIGIQPDVLIARTDYDVPEGMVEKVSLYTNVAPKAILPLQTVDSVYEVPLVMEEHGLDEVVAEKLKLEAAKPASIWNEFVANIKREKEEVTIAMVGKYTTMLDTYASVVEALKAAAWQNDRNLTLRWVDSEELENAGNTPVSGNEVTSPGVEEAFAGVQGIVVPGGFGMRGTEGKIAAIKYARESGTPYFGLCLGMQLATVEFARNVAGVAQATSQEFIDEGDQSEDNLRGCVIHIMEDQKTIEDKGGTMRLGGWDCRLAPDSISANAYDGSKQQKEAILQEGRRSSEAPSGAKDDRLIIRERHRHRYEFNNAFREQLEQAGLRIAGTTPDDQLVEIIEVKDHPWFVGVQFHPEFTSRPLSGHPLFNSFIAAAIGHGTAA